MSVVQTPEEALYNEIVRLNKQVGEVSDMLFQIACGINISNHLLQRIVHKGVAFEDVKLPSIGRACI